MAWTSRSRRFLSALCVALLVYSAIPHFHADAHPAHDARPQTLADALTPGLAPDDSHDSHSSSASVDSHPCALCRAQVGRELAATAPGPQSLENVENRRFEPAPASSRAERIFARRHPARGPPLA